MRLVLASHYKRHAVRLLCVTAHAVAAMSVVTAAHAFSPDRTALGLERPAPMATPVAVFGTDDRVALPREMQSLRDKVGYLFSPRARSMCTAFCVGDDVVATAAHCLYRTAAEPLAGVDDFWFGRGRDGARSRISGYAGGAAAQNITSGSMRLSVKPPIEATRDWALVRLAQPICKGRTLSLRPMPHDELASAAKAGRIFQVAYHRDFADWQLALGRNCGIRRDFDGSSWSAVSRDFVDVEDLILHTCDTGGASSGSPLLIETPQGPEVVGINVGTYVQSRVVIQNGEVVQRSRANDIANTGVNIRAVVPRLAAFQRARVIASPARLRTLQGLLKAHGHYSGPIDGAYGPALRAAIEQSERTVGQATTGLATETLLEQLARIPASPVSTTASIRSQENSAARR